MKNEGIRISGGTLRGRVVTVPSGKRVRPMRTRVRESLFSILDARVPGATFLDVFAGSGSIAIEALSRGASKAVLLEQDPEVLSVLRENLRQLHLTRRTEILTSDVYTPPLSIAANTGFDVIFLDPPFPHYGSPEHDPWALAFRIADEALQPDGILGLEYPQTLTPPQPAAGYATKTDRRYGDTRLILWERSND